MTNQYFAMFGVHNVASLGVRDDSAVIGWFLQRDNDAVPQDAYLPGTGPSSEFSPSFRGHYCSLH